MLTVDHASCTCPNCVPETQDILGFRVIGPQKFIPIKIFVMHQFRLDFAKVYRRQSTSIVRRINLQSRDTHSES